MNIIDERDVRTIHRKLKKKEYDGMMALSITDGDWVRLLDEGMVTYTDGSPYFYIAKGTLRKFYDSLADDYVGSINIGHTDLATFPERIVGQWTKSDLRLVDIEDGRQALDVKLNLNYDHPLVKALQMAPFDVGVSAEMYTHNNELMEMNRDLNPFGVPIIDEVDIRDFAIVGDAGNVNSMGIHLKGENKVPNLDELAKLLAEEGKAENLTDLTALLNDAVEDEAEEAAEEAPAEEAEEAEEAPAEEAPAEEAEEAETEEEEVEVTPADVEEIMAEDNLSTTWKDVLDEIVALREENKSLKAQLAAKLKEEKDALDAFKKLKVSLSNKPKQVTTTHEVQYTDGIGE